MMAALRQYRLLWLSALMAGIAAVYLLWLAPVVEEWTLDRTRDAGFVLTELNIDGVERSRRSDVLAALDVDNGMPMFAINLARIQNQLEALPWVKQAEVTRTLPGKLNIRLHERHPYALWQEEGKVWLIDPEGEVITNKGLADFTHLMLVVGKSAQKNVVYLQTMLEEFPELMARVKTAVRVGERRWDLVFDNGARLKLPEDDPLTHRSSKAWEKFAELQTSHNLLAREISVIDMRQSGRMILRVTPDGHKRMAADERDT